eukprot:440861-Pelagomonas_calceolata.AAC.3
MGREPLGFLPSGKVHTCPPSAAPALKFGLQAKQTLPAEQKVASMAYSAHPPCLETWHAGQANYASQPCN